MLPEIKVGDQAEHEAKKKAVRELLDSVYEVALRGKEQNPAGHPFWQDVDPADIPKAILFATGSNRKRLMMAVQLILLEGGELPDFLLQFQEKGPVDFWNDLKSEISNGNRETDTVEMIGYLGGVPVIALPNNGEKHRPEDGMLEEALHKTHELKREINAGKHLLPGISEEDRQNVLVVALDTMDRILHEAPQVRYMGDRYEAFRHRIEKESRASAGTGTGKPRRVMEEWFRKEADWGVGLDPNSAEHQGKFKDWYAREYFEGGSHIENMTGIAIERIDQDVTHAHIKLSYLDTEVDPQKVSELAENLDLDAALGGVFQLICDWAKLSDREMLVHPEHFDFFPPQEDFPLMNFILLCQIIGVPLHLIAFEIREALFPEEEQRERAHQRDINLFERRLQTMQAQHVFNIAEDPGETDE
jgi:hypothetical protein